MYKKTIQIVVVILIVFMSATAFASERPITVIADGEELIFDVPPMLHNSRTFVPFRALFEAYGATDIAWHQDLQKATGSINGTAIELTVGSNTAMVDGEEFKFDAPSMLKNGRVLVPIRFISESLGFQVGWNNATRTVIVKSPDYINAFYNSVLDVKLRMGQNVDELTALMGKTDRIDKSGKYYDWYIYNKDIKHYIQVGVFENKIVAFATNSSYWSLNDDLRIGSLKSDIEKKYKLQGTDYIRLRDNHLNILWDTHKRYSLSTFILEEEISSSDVHNEEVAEGFARQAFDLTNVYRIRNGKKELLWSDDLAEMALYHSNDMATNDYFSHVSLNGDEVCDRAVRYVGTKYGVGENIARGTLNALTAMNGLYNSTGHRKNMLEDDYEYLGVGAAFEKGKHGASDILYLTQDFQIVDFN